MVLRLSNSQYQWFSTNKIVSKLIRTTKCNANSLDVMKEFIEYIVKNLVEDPQHVNVNCYEGDQGIIVELRVTQGDIGKVVGRKGSTIKALRTVAMMVCARLGHRVRLELIE
jgi:hypothetical protein